MKVVLTDGSYHDVDIPPNGPVAHVMSFHGLPFLEANVVARLYLPVARDARPGQEDKVSLWPHEVVFANHVGAGAYQAHVAYQHIQELRKLV